MECSFCNYGEINAISMPKKTEKVEREHRKNTGNFILIGMWQTCMCAVLFILHGQLYSE